jgi:hypothetical protein
MLARVEESGAARANAPKNGYDFGHHEHIEDRAREADIPERLASSRPGRTHPKCPGHSALDPLHDMHREA